MVANSPSAEETNTASSKGTPIVVLGTDRRSLALKNAGAIGAGAAGAAAAAASSGGEDDPKTKIARLVALEKSRSRDDDMDTVFAR